jgi:hypothetical protein
VAGGVVVVGGVVGSVVVVGGVVVVVGVSQSGLVMVLELELRLTWPLDRAFGAAARQAVSRSAGTPRLVA